MRVNWRYGYLLRPPGPGCQPNDGLLLCREEDGEDLNGHHLWGWAIYSRELTGEEQEHYDLILLDRFEYKEA